MKPITYPLFGKSICIKTHSTDEIDTNTAVRIATACKKLPTKLKEYLATKMEVLSFIYDEETVFKYESISEQTFFDFFEFIAIHIHSTHPLTFCITVQSKEKILLCFELQVKCEATVACTAIQSMHFETKQDNLLVPTLLSEYQRLKDEAVYTYKDELNLLKELFPQDITSSACFIQSHTNQYAPPDNDFNLLTFFFAEKNIFTMLQTAQRALTEHRYDDLLSTLNSLQEASVFILCNVNQGLCSCEYPPGTFPLPDLLHYM